MKSHRVGRVVGHGCAVTLLLLAGTAGLLMSPAAAYGQVQFKTGAAVRPQLQSRAQLVERLDAMAGQEALRRVVVQLDGTATKQVRSQLASSGLLLLDPLGNGAYFASIDVDRLNSNALARSGRLLGVQTIDRRWKLHPDLDAGIVHPWMVVGQRVNPELKPAHEGDQEWEKQSLLETIVGVYVVLHDDVDVMAEGSAIAKRHGGNVRSFMRSINGMVIEMPYARINTLADEDAVQFIEPPLPKMSELNAENRALTGADIVQAAPYNLDGSGVTVLVYDGGEVFAGHADFGGRVTVGDTSGVSDHATHVAGTVGGGGGVNHGMAPGVDIISYGFEQEGGLSEGFLYTDPGDLEADYTAAIAMGADISNNSIGTNTAPNGFPCEWEGNYGITANLIDSIVRGSTGSPFRIVWANGNERGGFASCGSTYLTTAPPACGKNHITVGALNANDDSVTDFTSWGPCDDGRIKPDISAPGCQNGGDGGVTSLSSGGGFSVKCGTSMASPTVCGIGALLLQDFRAQFPGEPDFRNSTLKAILAQTAEDIVNPGPDYQSGYGSVRVQPAVDLIRAGNFTENEVDHGDSVGFVVVVAPGDPKLQITIAWDDVPGTPNVNPVLVNDLDLVVTSPSGTRHYPWTLDPSNPGNPAVRTQEDHLNNIEQVTVESPEAGGWTVEVVGFNIPQGPQPFSVAAEPFLVNCSDQGIATINGGKFACEDTVSVKVVDCGLNTSDMVTDTVNVNIASSSNPGGLNLTLVESAPESAAFLGSVVISEAPSLGELQVADGDTLTLTYLDADDGGGGLNIIVTDTAVVDCQSPIISNVMTSSVEPRSATVTLDTDEPAQVTIWYGLDCQSLTESVTSTQFNTSHSIELTGLDDDTAYAYIVEAIDQAGNGVIDDNSGGCFGFITPEVPDFFTEQFTSGFDLDGMSLTFVPVGGVDFYDACIEPIVQLPVDPSGGSTISLTDDDSEAVALTDGAMFPLYGTPYATINVGSNGYITLDGSDTDYSESLSEHFARVRVAALYDDLNPSTGGTVSYLQLSDRMVVTWQEIEQYSTGDSNTFQIELHFDGTVVISYLGIGAVDGIVGLSNGDGLSPDYFVTDLSNTGACGPRPPVAANSSIATPLGHAVVVQLVSSDDGLPDPPATLEYIIDSLPGNGVLTDPGAGLILSTPYTLAGGGSQVRYAPTGVYQGSDSFTFHTNDFGTMPDGGDSNTGTVGIDIGGIQPVHEFLVDDMDPNWMAEGQWAFGMPTGGGSHNFDPPSGFTGANVLGYNLNGDYPNNLSPAQYLTSTAIDCSSVQQTSVTFKRWLGVESSSFDHASFQVSGDGSSWTTIWDHSGSAVSESSWSTQTYDISAVADNQPTLFIRWSMGTTDGSVTYPGWNIDDIVISGLVPVSPCPGDVNLDGVVDINDLNAVIGNFGRQDAARTEGDVDGDHTVDINDLNQVLGNFGQVCS